MTETTTKAEVTSSQPLATSDPGVEQRPSRPKLKLGIPTLVLIAFWVVTEGGYRLEMGMFYRFASRMIALLVMLLFFLGWGFTRRHFTFAQRCLVFGIIMGVTVVMGVLSHPATGPAATAMIGLPYVMSLSVIWLWWTRRGSFRLEMTGIAMASIAVCGTIALLRWDGMDGRQRPELSWRWTRSPEELFLQQDGQSKVVPTVDQPPVLVETAADWTSFRGGEHENVVVGVQLADWSQLPPKEIWRKRVGPGWSSVIAVGEYLFTQEQRGDREAVVCYEANTGREVWIHTPKGVQERFEDSLSGTGPPQNPTFHQNRIYAFGAKGELECLDAVTGEPYWSHSLFPMADAPVPQWGSASSPTIVDDKVVVFVGGKDDKSVFAFDRTTGERRWQTAGGAISYSSPQVMTIAGERQIVMHDDAGLSGIRIQDGHRLWHHASPHAVSFQPMLQPHLMGDDRLIVNWDSGILCLRIRRDGETWRLEELWDSNRMKPSFNEFVIHGDHLYGLDDGILCCVNATNGQRRWKRGRYGFGQLLLLPQINELLVLTETGDVVRVAAEPGAHHEIGRFKAIDGKTWNHPLLAHGRLVVRNSEEMACFEISNPIVTADASDVPKN